MNYKCCYNCKERYIKKIDGKLKTCHAFCEKYKEYIKAFHKEQETIKEKRRLDNDSYSKAWIEYRNELKKSHRGRKNK